MSQPTSTRYLATNWSEYNAALRRRDSLLVCLDREMLRFFLEHGREGPPSRIS